MKAIELISVLQEENKRMQVENKKMREVLEFANRELSGLFHALAQGEKIDAKDAIAFIGSNIESFLAHGRM